MISSIARSMTLMLVSAATLSVVAADPEPDRALTLYTRSRVADPSSSVSFTIAYKTIQWDARKTAVVICDMWARHWCDGACKRGAEMAPRMNEFVKEARRRGSLIVHAPSGGMEHYADHPARKRAHGAPRAANLPEGVGAGCQGIEAEKQGEWPIDQADGGCDDQPRCPNRPMDRHQTSAIEIHDEDAITDSNSSLKCAVSFFRNNSKGVPLIILPRPVSLAEAAWLNSLTNLKKG